jgi:hypothetical protein
MKWFHTCTTLNEVKSLYKDLAKHGDTATMQEINNEYVFACAKLLKGESLTQEEIEIEITKIEAYRDAINAVINLEGIQIEVVGAWIWVTGNTYPHRTKSKGGTGILPEAGFVYASKKVAWYFRTDEYKTHNRKSMSLDEIRNKYGSTVVNSDRHNKFLSK